MQMGRRRLGVVVVAVAALLLLAVLAPVPSCSESVYISAAGDDSAGSGTATLPYQTLSRALGVANVTRVVLLASGGEFPAEGNCNQTLVGAQFGGSLTLLGEHNATLGEEAPLLNCTGVPGLSLSYGFFLLSNLRIFRAQAARSQPDGGAVRVESATAQFFSVDFRHNRARGDGGAIFSTKSATTLLNSTLEDNRAGGSGGGAYFESGSANVLSSNVTRNRAADHTDGMNCASSVVNVDNVTVVTARSGCRLCRPSSRHEICAGTAVAPLLLLAVALPALVAML